MKLSLKNLIAPETRLKKMSVYSIRPIQHGHVHIVDRVKPTLRNIVKYAVDTKVCVKQL